MKRWPIYILCFFFCLIIAGCIPTKRGDIFDHLVEIATSPAGYDLESKKKPEEIFNKGMAAFENKQFVDAQMLFAQYIAVKSAGKQVPKALFYQGECFYNQQIYLQAARYYQKVIDNFPSSSFYVPSLLKKGYIYQKTDKSEDAQKIFSQIANNHPNTPYAALAQLEVIQKSDEITKQAQVVSPLLVPTQKTTEKESSKIFSRDKKPPTILIFSHDVTRSIKITGSYKETTIQGRAIDESGIVEVLVDYKEAFIDAKGNFKADVYLKVGENKIDVSAMDRYGNQATQTITITRESMQKPLGDLSVKPAGKYHALIIGNDNYKYLPKLITATQDARDIAEVLEKHYSFKTRILIDAKRNELLSAINYYRNTLIESDKFLIYYAGHGEYDQTVNKAYWLPIDAKSHDDTNWIIVDTITSNIKRISSQHILVVVDSCYSGTFTRGTLTDLGLGRERSRYLEKMLQKNSRTLLASGGNEPVSDIGGNRHSVFAEAFLQGLMEMEEGMFSTEELFYKFIKERVAGKAEQIPEYSIIRNSGHNGGDFVFKRQSLHK